MIINTESNCNIFRILAIFFFVLSISVVTPYETLGLDIKGMSEKGPQKSENPHNKKGVTKEVFFEIYKNLIYRLRWNIRYDEYVEVNGVLEEIPELIEKVMKNSYAYSIKDKSIMQRENTGSGLSYGTCIKDIIAKTFKDINYYYYLFREDNFLRKLPKNEREERIQAKLDLISFYLAKIKKSKHSSEEILAFIDDFDKFADKVYIERVNNIKNKIAKRKQAKKKKKQARNQYVMDLKTGKKPIKSLSDAKIYYNAKDGQAIVINPPLKNDNKYYKATGSLYKKEGNYYFVEYQKDFSLNYFKFKLNKGLPEPDFRVGKKLTIVGKFINVDTYLTTNGTERYLPVFDATYVNIQ